MTDPRVRAAPDARNIPAWIILQYGAALAGLIVVTANPALRAAELRYVLQQSRSAWLQAGWTAAPHSGQRNGLCLALDRKMA